VTKDEMLDALARANGLSSQAIADNVMIAIEWGATEEEVARRMGLTVSELWLNFRVALEEVGRLPARPHCVT
jgi:lambda repressor-like predicted transcriptional regulator